MLLPLRHQREEPRTRPIAALEDDDNDTEGAGRGQECFPSWSAHNITAVLAQVSGGSLSRLSWSGHVSGCVVTSQVTSH